MPDQPAPVVLTIAGFDPSGGAGIIADVKAISALGCVPVAAVTSLTFQNSQRVFGAIHQTSDALRAQVLAVLEEHEIAAVKIGMVPTAELAFEVVRLIRENDLPAPVVDPVVESSSGGQLMEPAALQVLLSQLMPLARVVTPNIPEAERMAGMLIDGEEQMIEAARVIREKWAPAVLIKGGHGRGAGEQAIDVLNEAGTVTIFRGEWIDSGPVRGTGCAMSSAIAASLANGMNLREAIAAAKNFVAELIRKNPAAALSLR